jgi:hypothetical protein
MVKSLLLVCITPIFYILIYRQLLPLHWYITVDQLVMSEYILVYRSHILYLCLQMLLNILLLSHIVRLLHNKSKIYKKTNFSPEGHLPPHSEKISIKIILIFIVTAILLRDTIPILQGLNSENLVNIIEENKLSSLFGYGTLGVISTYAMVALAYGRTSRKKTAFLLAILPAIMVAKKAALLVFFQDLVLLFMLASRSVTHIPFWRFAIGLTVAVLFGISIYLNMMGFDFENLFLIKELIFNMYYASATSYLNVMWQDMGYALADDYRREIGTPVMFQYLANPFLKVLSLGGIEYSVGPYLASSMYGTLGEKILTGINPTLFFELTFIGGELFGVPISFIFIIIIYLILFRLIDHISRNYKIGFFDLCIYWETYKLLISIQYDILNGYKSSLVALGLLFIIKIITRLKFR